MNIIDIPAGGKVSEPGLYKMSMEDYHSVGVCPGPSVSSTGIRTAHKSPHAFWKTSSLNPDRYPPKEDNSSLILGKAAHSLILGDEVFDETFCFVPKDAPARPTATQVKAFERDGEWSAKAAEGAAFWEKFDKEAEGRLELKHDQVQKIQYMAENLAADPLAVEMLVSNLIEISMIWQDPITGLWLKSRPDAIPSNGYDFGDLKTFAPKGRDLVLSAIRSTTDFEYAMQMALAIEGAEHVMGTTASRCGLVFVQSSEPYEVIPLSLDEDTLYWARVLCRDGINKISHGLKTGEWPGVTGGKIVEYSYPETVLHRLANLQADGTLPSLER
jgi:hypothetical protein